MSSIAIIESQVLHYPNIRVLYGLDSVTVKAGLEDLQEDSRYYLWV